MLSEAMLAYQSNPSWTQRLTNRGQGYEAAPRKIF